MRNPVPERYAIVTPNPNLCLPAITVKSFHSLDKALRLCADLWKTPDGTIDLIAGAEPEFHIRVPNPCFINKNSQAEFIDLGHRFATLEDINIYIDIFYGFKGGRWHLIVDTDEVNLVTANKYFYISYEELGTLNQVYLDKNIDTSTDIAMHLNAWKLIDDSYKITPLGSRVVEEIFIDHKNNNTFRKTQ